MIGGAIHTVSAQAAAVPVPAIHQPEGLPWQILALLILLTAAAIVWAAKQVNGVKKYLGEPPFPTQILVVISGVIGFAVLMTIAACRLALGLDWPDNYGDMILLDAGALGIGGLWGVGKHAFSAERERAKTEGAIAVAAASNAQNPTQQGNAAPGGTVIMQAAQPKPAPPAVILPQPIGASAGINPDGEGD